ncbi:hypothetical protein CEUSTIGMA_g5142.t1 [Chlamydomonas eustigma]|uniref:Cilia- and flagella-associated protein 99 n=1 Tax=Chlamydomonas eustigma TaxID=1157962 RepID=A0A250X452_9CHLO|nr:hypothetical protein CEUSTIGMA_g5142.t1 [Chlamydomonas eustigma]|eukprot:GAX77699.1 hypothetical protein CEUSTIGMA_g5142.t1 [Chlamydomonas eustigma]
MSAQDFPEDNIDDDDAQNSSRGSNRPRTHSLDKPMGPAKLLEITETMYRDFNPAQVTLDTHADQALSKLQIHSQLDDVFIRQVLYGIVRYRQFLGSLMDSFYYYNSGVANREDRDMYKVMAYLTIFRMEELGFINYRRLVDAKEPQKMVVFLRYLFNEAYLREAIRDDWLKLYDKEFVDETVGRILSWKPEVQKMLDSLEETVYLTRKKSDEKEASTSNQAGNAANTRPRTLVQEPFNLSQPRPKPLPVEDPPPPPIHYRSAPKFRDGPTKEELALQAAREANWKAAEEKLAKAEPFKLRCTERPTNLDKIRAEIEADITRELTFQPPKPRAVPPAPMSAVKLNTAAILREDALYRKKQQQEAEMLKKFESELHDASEFKAWQARMLSMDEAHRASSIERRRREMAETQEAAIRARKQKVEDNQELGRQLKAEAKEIEEGLAREREEATKAKQAMRAAVVEARGNVAVAAEKVAIEKRLAAEEERQRQEMDTKLLAEQEIRDLAEKRDIIMQLRALERVPRQRVKEFDPTVTPDHGLLETMSLMELRERLSVVRRRRQEEEERQRSSILKHKQERDATLQNKVVNIQRVRKVAAVQSQMRRVQRVDNTRQAAASLALKHEDDVLDLHSKLEAKRAAASSESTRIAAEEKKIKFEQMQQAAGAAAVEENKFRELRSGAQRELVERQSTKLATATQYEATKAKAQSVRMRNVKQEVKAKQNFLAAYDEKIAQLTQMAHKEREQDLTYRQGLASTVRDFEQNQRSKHAQETTRRLQAQNSTMQAKLQALASGMDVGI